jgi:hypothetical protein
MLKPKSSQTVGAYTFSKQTKKVKTNIIYLPKTAERGAVGGIYGTQDHNNVISVL